MAYLRQKHVISHYVNIVIMCLYYYVPFVLLPTVYLRHKYTITIKSTQLQLCGD